ncbi:MAG: helix-hairpin-helix domain-containing protein [Planctomycetota bacterium]
MTEDPPSLESVVVSRVAERLKFDPGVVGRVLERLGEAKPIPFLARYRRDEVGGLDEASLRDIRGEAERVREMEQRREFILRAVAERPDVPERMRRRIERCRYRLELEYLYEPYRPPRKTPGTVWRERGLGPLAEAYLKNEVPGTAEFVDAEKGVDSEGQALEGAREILAERFSVDPEVRGAMLRAIEKEGVVHAAPAHGKESIPDRCGQFKTYEERLSKIPSHRFLALHRAETEGALSLRITFPDTKVLAAIQQRFYPKECGEEVRTFLDLASADAVRLLQRAIAQDALNSAKNRADAEAISVFTKNLCDLLLYPPAGPRRVLGVDPSPRGAIPIACVDERGQHLEHVRLKFFDKNEEKVARAREVILRLVQTHKIEMVAIGNGQGRHQCEAFLSECLMDLGEDTPAIVVVNEVGVGSYASGPVGRAELPALPVPARGAVSLARRLMDPLPELVKVDPRQIGVGQYQNDIDAARLGRALDEVVEHCVNYVGVDLNRAPVQQLAYVCGLTTSVARSIVEHRERHGPFRTLQAVHDLPFVSDRAFEQAGGFLHRQGACGRSGRPDRQHGSIESGRRGGVRRRPGDPRRGGRGALRAAGRGSRPAPAAPGCAPARGRALRSGSPGRHAAERPRHQRHEFRRIRGRGRAAGRPGPRVRACRPLRKGPHLHRAGR